MCHASKIIRTKISEFIQIFVQPWKHWNTGTHHCFVFLCIVIRSAAFSSKSPATDIPWSSSRKYTRSCTRDFFGNFCKDFFRNSGLHWFQQEGLQKFPSRPPSEMFPRLSLGITSRKTSEFSVKIPPLILPSRNPLSSKGCFTNFFGNYSDNFSKDCFRNSSKVSFRIFSSESWENSPRFGNCWRLLQGNWEEEFISCRRSTSKRDSGRHRSGEGHPACISGYVSHESCKSAENFMVQQANRVRPNDEFSILPSL